MQGSASSEKATEIVSTYTVEQFRQSVLALEDPFDPREIKWRVTNTGPDRRRGQVIAYADPRAYTDRLNALFTVRGWTREYTVQMIQNFERKEGGNGDGIISGKIVVTCRLTIDGLGTHSGLGEEWADNENAGTSAEAQAFKRACSCFGLGRYLYDLGGNWVDLDDRKQPLSTPRLPDWALPKRRPGNTSSHNGNAKPVKSGYGEIGDLSQRVRVLCEQVGLGLARSVTASMTGFQAPEEIRDAGALSALSMKLQDTLRGVERLRAAIGIVGDEKYSQLCGEMGLAGDCVDNIPDRRTLRQLIGALEAVAGPMPQTYNGTGRNGISHETVNTVRGELIREAQRVGRLRRMRVAEVVDRAAKGAFRFTDLQRLSPDSLPAMSAAVALLRGVER